MVLVTEVAKILLCTLTLSFSNAWRNGGGSNLRSLMLALAPAGLYLVQNLALQQAYRRLARAHPLDPCPPARTGSAAAAAACRSRT